MFGIESNHPTQADCEPANNSTSQPKPAKTSCSLVDLPVDLASQENVLPFIWAIEFWGGLFYNIFVAIVVSQFVI